MKKRVCQSFETPSFLFEHQEINIQFCLSLQWFGKIMEKIPHFKYSISFKIQSMESFHLSIEIKIMYKVPA